MHNSKNMTKIRFRQFFFTVFGQKCDILCRLHPFSAAGFLSLKNLKSDVAINGLKVVGVGYRRLLTLRCT